MLRQMNGQRRRSPVSLAIANGVCHKRTDGLHGEQKLTEYRASTARVPNIFPLTSVGGRLCHPCASSVGPNSGVPCKYAITRSIEGGSGLTYGVKITFVPTLTMHRRQHAFLRSTPEAPKKECRESVQMLGSKSSPRHRRDELVVNAHCTVLECARYIVCLLWAMVADGHACRQGQGERERERATQFATVFLRSLTGARTRRFIWNFGTGEASLRAPQCLGHLHEGEPLSSRSYHFTVNLSER